MALRKIDIYTDLIDQYGKGNAQQKLSNYEAQKPDNLKSYTSKWGAELGKIADDVNDRAPFSYDINSDALYQQFADNYIQQGKLASEDAIGQASALTGGYANSYAQSVGQQTYQNYLRELNNMIPEFEQMARNKYDKTTEDLLNRYSLLSADEADNYSKWKDDWSMWEAERQNLQTAADKESDYDKWIAQTVLGSSTKETDTMYLQSVDDYKTFFDSFKSKTEAIAELENAKANDELLDGWYDELLKYINSKFN